MRQLTAVLAVLSFAALLPACQSQIAQRTAEREVTGTATALVPTSLQPTASVTSTPRSTSPSSTVSPHRGLVVIGPSGDTFTFGSTPGKGAVQHITAGVVLPVEAMEGGWAKVLTPCENHGWVPVTGTTTVSHATVVLDPGHGGNETGAVGSGGLAEKTVNLDVATRAAQLLQSEGVDVVLTRTSDYMATLAFRVAVAAAVQPAAFVSIHHNAMPDGPRSGPGTETFYQYTSASSKRLAGLLYEETTAALASYPASWVGNTDAGARWRLNSAGGDYYGILRLSDTDHLTAALAEMMFISNPTEEALLRRDDVRQTEAGAIVRAVTRFLDTNDPGSGFSTPHPRKEPAGGGGGTAGCIDPIGP